MMVRGGNTHHRQLHLRRKQLRPLVRRQGSLCLSHEVTSRFKITLVFYQKKIISCYTYITINKYHALFF